MKIICPSGPRKATRVTTSTMYGTIPEPLPPSLASLNYEASLTGEFGNMIQFATGTPRRLGSIRIGMVTWAYFSKYNPGSIQQKNTGWRHPITLNIYKANSDYTVGALLGSLSYWIDIPWRPEPVPTCTGARWFSDVDQLCHSGMAFDVGLDFAPLAMVLPERVIFGIAYDTQHAGNPIGTIGPYNDLNVGVSNTNVLGINPVAPQCYLKSAAGDSYADGGAGGLNTYRLDIGGVYPDVAIEFDSSEGDATPMSVLFHSYRQRRE